MHTLLHEYRNHEGIKKILQTYDGCNLHSTNSWIIAVPVLAALPQSWVIAQTDSILWATERQRLQREKVFFLAKYQFVS